MFVRRGQPACGTSCWATIEIRAAGDDSVKRLDVYGHGFGRATIQALPRRSARGSYEVRV